MVNTNLASIVINCSPEELSRAAVKAFHRVAAHYIEVSSIPSDAILSITAATYRGAIFAKFVALRFPEGAEHDVDADYVNLLLKAYLEGHQLYEAETHRRVVGDCLDRVPYRSSYLGAFLRGIASSLLLMQYEGAITLPFKFQWPIRRIEGSGKEEREVIGHLPPLLELTLSAHDDDAHPVLRMMAKRQRVEVFSVCTKLVLALGWLKPSDANYDDLFELANSELRNSVPTISGIPFFVSLLKSIYGNEVSITRAGWDSANSKATRERRISSRMQLRDANYLVGEHSKDAFEFALSWESSDCYPDRAEQIFKDDDPFIVSTWLCIEKAYARHARYESPKTLQRSIGVWNVYLFVYLPAWYRAHPGCGIPYPDSPNKLLAAVFVSDIGLVDEGARPLAFTAFMERQAEVREWASGTHYGYLKQLEQFFSYIERFADGLPESSTFRQPLGASDMPRHTRARTTNKRPIPRRVFRLYVSYVEALIQYTDVLLGKVLAEEMHSTELWKICSLAYIDTVRWAPVVGFVPIVFYNGRGLPLRYIPLVISESVRRLRDGRVLRVPEPHGLYQIYVALHTGIRHQHIQWLDARTFDSQVSESDREFTKLHVNTDKVKNRPWEAFVERGVIDVLRKQKAWRDLIANQAFDEGLYYGNNPKSKWGKIVPLFACGENGSPTPDSRYMHAWSRILCGVQALISDAGARDVKLGDWLPSAVDYGLTPAERARQCAETGARKTEMCEVAFKSDITPHSARSSVVTHYITFLPADVIGKNITGQSKATVHYYTVPDPEETRLEQLMQGRALRRTDYYKQQCLDEIATGAPSSRHVKADSVNSVFAAGIRADPDKTLVAFGCMSLSMQETGESGIDVLRRTQFVAAVETKTEICPYGGICPPDVLKHLGAIRKCALCPYAVRHIDHLPAVCAKGRQVFEQLVEVEAVLDAEDLTSTYSPEEVDRLEAERSDLAQELTAWRLVEECLEHARQQRATAPEGTWVVGKPEILERDLRAAVFPTNETDYLLERLSECLSYPTLESPAIRARFDLMRRQILAKTGNVREALSARATVSPAKACAGLIRSVVNLHNLTMNDLERIVTTSDHLDIPSVGPVLLQVSE